MKSCVSEDWLITVATRYTENSANYQCKASVTEEQDSFEKHS